MDRNLKSRDSRGGQKLWGQGPAVNFTICTKMTDADDQEQNGVEYFKLSNLLPGMSDLASNLIRLAPNGPNLGLF